MRDYSLRSTKTDQSVLGKRTSGSSTAKGPTIRPILTVDSASRKRDEDAYEPRTKKVVSSKLSSPQPSAMVDEAEDEDSDQEETKVDAVQPWKGRTRAGNANSVGKCKISGSRNRKGGFHIDRSKYEQQIDFQPDSLGAMTDLGKKLYQERVRPNMGEKITKKMLQSKVASKTQAAKLIKDQYVDGGKVPKLTYVDKSTGKTVAISRNHKIADSQITRLLYDMTAHLSKNPDVDTALDEDKSKAVHGFFKAFGTENPDGHLQTIKQSALLLRDNPKAKILRETAANLGNISNELSLSDLNLKFGFSEINSLIGNSSDPHIKNGTTTPTSTGLINSIVNLSNVGLVNAKLTDAITKPAVDRATGKPITSDIDLHYQPDEEMGLAVSKKKKKGKKNTGGS